MYFVKVDKDGNVLTEPKPLSGDPTASPNIDWKQPQLDIHGFRLVDLQNEKIVGGKVLTITEKEKQDAVALQESIKLEKKTERANAKQSVLQKLKLDVSDLPGLRALIEDMNDE